MFWSQPAHDNLLRCAQQENSASEGRSAEAELEEYRDAACDAAAQLKKTNDELCRSVRLEIEVSQKLGYLEVNLQNSKAQNFENASDSDARLPQEQSAALERLGHIEMCSEKM